MTRIGLLLCAIAALTGAHAAGDEPQALRPTKAIELFNHRNLDGWSTWLRASGRDDPRGVFGVRDGVLRISGEDWGGIATGGAYRDYHLVVEWRWGSATWGERKDRARDSGILVHGVGADGAASGAWLESVEAQVIEGGAGDFILVKGLRQPTLTARVRDQGGQVYWDKGGAPRLIESGRINWFGRDPEWKDVLGFRGRQDVQKPAGEWNRQEVIADGDSLTALVNGVVVNAGTGSSHSAGRIQLQSEGAEIFIRTVRLEPLEK